jgi:hypothetical protein
MLSRRRTGGQQARRGAAAEGLARRAREVDAEDASAIREEVAAVLDVLDAAFG